MPQRLGEIVTFRGDRLFHGAVNVDWFSTDAARAELASKAFVFHGPRYHGVQQQDVGTSHGHRLIDTAGLSRDVVRQAYGLASQPFTLAIAGYGTGKSHLALTLASLLNQPSGDGAACALLAIRAADEAIGSEVQAILEEGKQKPCLVVALNGMQSFDLTAEVTRQLVRRVRERGLDCKPFEDLRPRFGQAANLIRMSNAEVVEELTAFCGNEGVEDVLAGLEQQDEQLYGKVHDFFASRGVTIRALAGESVRDVLDVAVREYCGEGKPFRSLLVLFDEFGRYTEFATVRSHIAGSGALQDLFEVIQSHEGVASFVGFIQFELNAYVQRIAPEYRNEILRYVTRYQAAKRVYLSINLETLLASLLEKRQPKELEVRFDSREARRDTVAIMQRLQRWFPQSANHRLWTDAEEFHQVIRRGCWPLSALSTWFLYYLASAGKHLQERSALALLGDAIARHEQQSVPAERDWALAPVDLWSDALLQELLTSEEGGQQGSVTHALASVDARHGPRLTVDQRRILQAIVLGSKLGLQAHDRRDAIEALAALAGMQGPAAENDVEVLRDEYNVIEWDEAFKEFNILGDAVPRTQFLAFLKQRVASSYDEAAKARMFASKAGRWCDLLADVESDFAEEHGITTREWRFRSFIAHLDHLATQVKLAAEQWRGSFGVDDPRGTVIYCYVERNRDVEEVASQSVQLLRAAAKEAGTPVLPIMIVLLFDETGVLGQSLAEMAILEEKLSNEDRGRFGNLIPAHEEKLQQTIRDTVEAKLKERRYLTALREPVKARRRDAACGELFRGVYKKPIPFPFDGFTTARGNAADTCQELTAELLTGRLDYEAVMAKPVKTKNRAITVLKDSWGVFAQNGVVLRRPGQDLVKSITERWDEQLRTGTQRLPVADALRQLCLPPYGGNVASVGLLLAVFVAPRVDKLAVVRGEEQVAISQWVQDGIFRGKFIDLAGLQEVALVNIGEASSEWETLLDEWEQSRSYLAWKDGLDRADALRARIPVPPALGYREVHLRQQAQRAVNALSAMEHQQDEAIEKMEEGLLRGDVSRASWGAAELGGLMERLAAERPLWTDAQVSENQPRYERARQEIIQIFSEWLPQQRPNGDSPAIVGDFKHKMIDLLGRNLKKIGLDAQCQEVQRHALLVMRKAETAADANQLLRDVTSWLATNQNVTTTARMADLRALRKAAHEWGAKLRGMSERISLSDLGTARTRVVEFGNALRDADAEIMKRTGRLSQAKLRSEEDIERLLTDVDSLLPVFDGLPDDQDYLVVMRRALRLYQRHYQQLAEERLTWTEFERLAGQLREEGAAALSDDAPPWTPDDTIAAIVESLSRRRTAASESWIDALEQECSQLDLLSVVDVTRLHSRTSAAPAVLTAADEKRLAKLVNQIEARLDTLNVEWLLERFRQLSGPLQKKFLALAQAEFL